MNRFSVVFALLASTLPVACKKEVPPPPMAAPSVPAPPPAPPPATVPSPKAQAAALVRVHFALDSATLDEAARAALRQDAELLRAHPEVRIEIEGHCDERGTTEYNLALGERRASAVRKFLAAEGIAPARLATISYGEERPARAGQDEGAWAENRRAAMRVTSGDGVADSAR